MVSFAIWQTPAAPPGRSRPRSWCPLAPGGVVGARGWPDPHTLRLAGVRSPAELLGFYHGVPQTQRTTSYALVPPDKISIYQRPIELQCRTADQVRAMAPRVVRHELAHHFGLSDDRLREIGAY
ncbi:MAG: metallopeptidase family protein [Chloroflexi bacterium]|nr:metallopeptidase family protein [Chloroflexota bacterium]